MANGILCVVERRKARVGKRSKNMLTREVADATEVVLHVIVKKANFALGPKLFWGRFASPLSPSLVHFLE